MKVRGKERRRKRDGSERRGPLLFFHCRPFSSGWKVHFMSGNWCRDFVAGCPSCRQPVLKTSIRTHHFYNLNLILILIILLHALLSHHYHSHHPLFPLFFTTGLKPTFTTNPSCHRPTSPSQTQKCSTVLFPFFFCYHSQFGPCNSLNLLFVTF